MQNVSDAWKENQLKTMVDENYIEISVDMADPAAVADASATDSGSLYYANTSQIVIDYDKSIAATATGEPNIWPLDGSVSILLDDYGDTGYISSSMCGEDGVFVTPPLIYISFTETHNNPVNGFTITWSEAYGEYATDFVVTVYNGSEVVAQSEVTDNTDITSIVLMDYQGYDLITIQVNAWSWPYRYARITDVLIGTEKVYTKADLFSYRQEMSADPLSAALPKYSITYEVSNVNNDYDPNNLTGLAQYLVEQQKVTVRYGYKFDGVMEWISGGVYYLSEWESPQNGITATFTARDTLEFLTATYTKGVYNAAGVSLYDLAERVLQDANIPLNIDGGTNWAIGDTLKGIYTTAALPVDTYANCLQLIANAACCVMYYDRTGRLYIEPLVTSSPDPLANASVSDNGAAVYADTAQIIDRTDKEYLSYITAEPNIWTLDGSFYAIPDEGGAIGFVSDTMCDEDGDFATPPIIILTFKQVHKIAASGLTIVWGEAYGEYATSYTVSAYNDDTLIVQETVTDNASTTTLVDMYMQGYNKITIQINEWSLPYRRARVQSVTAPVGYEITLYNSYTKPEIVLTKPLSGVDVSAYNYYTETDAAATELYNGALFVNGTQTITLAYSKAAVNVSAAVDGGTLDSAVYYTNYCELTVTATGEVTIIITGTELLTSETVISLTTGVTGTVQGVENPLITSTEQAANVAEWVQSYLSLRRTLTSDWRADPRLDVLDIVSHENNYAKQPVRMTSVVFEYGGGFRGAGEGRALDG